MSHSPIVVEVVLAEGVVVGHLPPKERIGKAVAALKKSGKDEDAQRILAVDELLRTTDGFEIESRSYKWRPYTYGEELAARREATTVTETGSSFDVDEYNISLMSRCLGKEHEEILSMEPALFAGLRQEISVRVNPTQEALDFFAWPPTTSPGAKPSDPSA